MKLPIIATVYIIRRYRELGDVFNTEEMLYEEEIIFK